MSNKRGDKHIRQQMESTPRKMVLMNFGPGEGSENFHLDEELNQMGDFRKFYEKWGKRGAKIRYIISNRL